MLEQSRRVGHIGHAEVEMIENVFDLEDRRVRSMLTPRREVSWLDADASWEETRAALIEASHSRLPVARGELDRLVGVVHVHALLDRCLLDEPIDVEAMAEEALVVPESLSSLSLLDRFRDQGTRFAVVLDEYGGVEGIVTAGDVLTALLGELADHADEGVPFVERLGEEEFDLDGKLYVEELKDLLDVPALPREDDRDYRTLGGLVTTMAGRIPDVGEVVVAAGWRFEVTALDGPRVDRVHVRRAAPGEEGLTHPAEGPAVRRGDELDDGAADPEAGDAEAGGQEAGGREAGGREAGDVSEDATRDALGGGAGDGEGGGDRRG
jgi:putative hemolysin